MGPPRRKLLATAEETMRPPDALTESQSIARVVKAVGNNLYNVTLPEGKEFLVEMPAKFRSTIWLKRGGYVLIDTTSQQERDNKIQGEIINVVRDEKLWRKEQYWPKQFEKRSTAVAEDSDEERSNVGMMPPSDEED